MTLLRRLAGNSSDKDAWREFVDHYGSRIFRWCRNRGLQGADADDLTQDLLLKLAQKFKTFEYDPTKSFHAWLKVVTNNALNDALRKNRRAHDAMGSLAARRELLDDLQPLFDRELLEEAMSRVELRVELATWQAFRLTGIEGKSTSEAARLLNMPEGRIRVYKGRISKLIREEIHKLEKTNDN